MRDLLVHPVHRQRVLDQIIGADAEKLHVSGQGIGHNGRRGSFDHRPDFQVLVERDVFPTQLGFALFDQLVGLLQFLQAGNHRVHHLQVAFGAGPQNRPELRAEDVAFLQGDADRAPA